MVDYQEILGVMRRSTAKTKELLREVEPRRVTRKELLDLEYEVGEEVIDSVTGERGRIGGSTTAYITKV